jgi:hypothetical protein
MSHNQACLQRSANSKLASAERAWVANAKAHDERQELVASLICEIAAEPEESQRQVE